MDFFKRYYLVFACIITLGISLTGCQEKSGVESADVKNVEKAENKKQNPQKEKKIPAAGSTVSEMVNQPQGLLMEKHMKKDLDGQTGWDGMNYIKYYNETFQPLSEKELKTYFLSHKNLDSQEIYYYLVHMLGSGEYKQYYEKLLNYQHGYVMPELPEGPDEVANTKKKTNIIVLMDASGSMKESVTGGTKMKLAKKAIGTFMSQLPPDSNSSLLVYGHKGSGSEADKEMSCKAVESVYPL
ncbi:hypothetical protein JOC77_000819 [Peribacillus deserti]|uniref:VWA domain-containing protein n=1 Tax=Peribacillus deserti TaxID=673318 RepID=A0ABS2QFD6_9BACI|nr:hypothetical protein [Peribacillus deserti]MBM7691414.1 hypothetical protein [Peribacillus deserti]